MEFIAPTRTEWGDVGAAAGKKRIQHRVAAPYVGKHQVFVKRTLHRSCVRNAENGVGALDVVRHAETRFSFSVRRKSVVEIAAQSEIQRPVSFGDRILDVKTKFLDVGVAVKRVKGARRARA